MFYNKIKAAVFESGFNYTIYTKNNIKNIYVFGDGDLILNAHHDVVNPNTENLLDNGASCNMLLDLILYYQSRGKMPFHVTFTDLEEYGGKGAQILSEHINIGLFGQIRGIINFELCSIGNHLWSDDDSNLDLTLISKAFNGGFYPRLVETPFNDSWIFRKNNIPSVCVGLAEEKYWPLCHSPFDMSEFIYKEEDVNCLKENIIEYFQYKKQTV